MEKTKTKTNVALEVTVCAMFTAITAVLSQIAIPIGPVPISCSLIAVYLSGLLLSPKLAVISQLVYLLLGAVGVPVFANFGAGIAKLAGPTGGYLAVYPVLALILSLFMLVYDKRVKQEKTWIRVAFLASILVLSLAVCYLTGTLWFCLYSGSTVAKALSLTVIPFIAGDIVKIVLCIILTLSLRPLFLKTLQKHGMQ